MPRTLYAIVGIALANIVGTVLSNIYAGYFSHNQQYYTIYAVVGITILAIIIDLLSSYRDGVKLNYLSSLMKKVADFLRSPITIPKAFFFFLIMVLTIYPYVSPLFENSDSKIPFEITEPKEGSHVNLTSTVSGHGAVPSSSVKVYVIGKYQPYLEGTTTAHNDGNWTCEIHCGDGPQQVGESYKIFANSTQNGKYYETPYINVIRS